MRNWNWPVIGFFVLMTVLCLIGMVGALEPTLCEPGKLAAAARQQDVVVFRCWEFWLNRYQGLLGNVITATVAGATLIWVAKQLNAANRQAAVAASQALRTRASELEALHAEVDSYRTAALDFMKNVPRIDEATNYPILINSIMQYIEVYQRATAKTETLLDRSSYREFDEKMNFARKDVIDFLSDSREITWRIVPTIRQMQRDYGPIVAENAKRAIEDGRTACARTFEPLDIYEDVLTERISAAWGRIRSFEAAAID